MVASISRASRKKLEFQYLLEEEALHDDKLLKKRTQHYSKWISFWKQNPI
jgi:hypothetical protein